MKVPLVALALVLCQNTHAPAQSYLFRSRPFSMTSTSVIQGTSKATALSKNEIVSTFHSSYRRKIRRVVELKFSINGLDNERPFGQNHLLTLPASGGACVSPVYVFGQPDPRGELKEAGDEYLGGDADVRVRLDMREVLRNLGVKGYYETCDGQRIGARDLKGVYIAGGTEPLSWDFKSLASNPNYELTDEDADSIYEVMIRIPKEQQPKEDSRRVWKLQHDLSQLPRYDSPNLLIDALYSMALEELLLGTGANNELVAGALWPGVWTRDVSYSILLSLAIVNPDASKTSLLTKVKNDRIVQDTGTGGSWPVSTDRMVWALAAWEVYLVTGDIDWLNYSYRVIKNSSSDDMATAFDQRSGLFCGESSFLDWREQTYPRWMDPRDIYWSKNLGTNAVHYETYRALAKMAELLGSPPQEYLKIASRIRKELNSRMWVKEKGYFGQYLYGRTYQALSPRSESLGEALTVLFDVADPLRRQEIVENTPVTTYGIPCIFPQIPDIPPYHNDAVWPFVEAFWAWASAKAGNERSVERALASLYRAAGLFLTNKENMVASTGDFAGTEINSDRQLWSIAGNLSTIYRVIFGMSFTPDSLRFNPFIPKVYSGVHSLENFKYRKATLTIAVAGYGGKVQATTLDGHPLSSPRIPANLIGKHTVHITMANVPATQGQISLVENRFSPETPHPIHTGSTLQWGSVHGARAYGIYRNGTLLAKSESTSFTLPTFRSYAEYQVMAVGTTNVSSFLSEPLTICSPSDSLIVHLAAHSGDVLRLTGKDTVEPIVPIELPEGGLYRIDIRYANGSGPVNTDNKCAIRTLGIDDKVIGSIVMPQRGNGNWTDWGYSNPLYTRFSQGSHTIRISFLQSDNNMNGEINAAHVDYVRCTLLR